MNENENEHIPTGGKYRKLKIVALSCAIFIAVVIAGLVAAFGFSASSPKSALRAFLPHACFISMEIHEPATVSRHLLREDFFSALPKNSAWRLLKNFGDKNDIDIDAQLIALKTALSSAVKIRAGINNCAAIAMGVTPDGEIAGLIALDRTANFIAQIAARFLPSAENYRVLEMQKFAASDANNSNGAPDLFITFFADSKTKTRGVIFASSPNLLKNFRFASPAKIKSLFPSGEIPDGELTLNLTDFLVAASFGDATIGGSPVGESFWRWKSAEINGETQVSFAATNFDRKLFAPPSRFMPPPQFAERGGLFFNSTFAREILSPENLVSLLTVFDFPQAEIWAKKFREHRRAIDTLKNNFTGNFAAQILTPTNNDWRDVAALTVEVDNPDDAERNIAAGIRALISPPKSTNNFLSSFAPSALVKITETSRHLVVNSPLLPYELHGVFADRSSEINACGIFSATATPTVPRSDKNPTIANGFATSEIRWQYVRQWDKFFAEISAAAKQPLLIRALNLTGFSAKTFADAIAICTDINDVLTGFSAFASKLSILPDADSLTTTHTFTGKLRIEKVEK